MKTTPFRIQTNVSIFQTDTSLGTEKSAFLHLNSDTFDPNLRQTTPDTRTEVRQCRSVGGSDSGFERPALSISMNLFYSWISLFMTHLFFKNVLVSVIYCFIKKKNIICFSTLSVLKMVSY